ncbi:hypothetical protein M3E04_000030 [Micrococcus luteus]|nr:hypothetical protein [Micrococcus luteus]
MAAGIGLVTITYAVTGSLLSELFPAEYRYSGVSLGCNLAGALSGFLPFLASWMIGVQETKTSMPAIVILVAIFLLTALGGSIGERVRVKDETEVKAD